jgi:hypothetical protein
MEDYATQIFNYLQDTSGFDEGYTIESFKETLKSDGGYTDTLYEHLVGLDPAFKDALDSQTFRTQMLDFGDSKPQEPEEEEIVVERTEITSENVAEGYDQAISLYDDVEYKPELTGDEREDAKAELMAERDAAVNQINENEGIRAAADEIDAFRFKEMNATQKEKDQAAVDAKNETTEQGFLNAFTADMASGQYQEENPEMLERVEEDLKSGMWWNVGEIWKATTDDDYAKNKGKKLAQAEYKIATDKWANQTTKDLINAADRLGYTKEQKEALNKSLINKDNKSTLVRGGSKGVDGNPKPADFATANNLPAELVDEAMKIAGDRKATENRFKLNKKELDEKLTKFEDDFGVTAVLGHLSGTFQALNETSNSVAEMLDLPYAQEMIKLQEEGAKGLEELGLGTDQTYQKNREILNNIILSKQKSENHKINATVYVIESSRDRMALTRDRLLNLEARANSGEQLSVNEMNEYKSLIKAYNADADLAKQSMVELGQLTVASDNFDEIRDETLKTYSTLSVYGNNIGSSIVRLGAGLGTLAHELSLPQVLKWQGMDLEDEAFRSELASQIDGFLGTNAGDAIENGLEIMADQDKMMGEVVNNMHDYHAEIKAENRDKMEFGEIENAADFFSWGFEGISENAVNLAASAVIPGGGGLILMAAAESGNKMHEMNKEMEGVTWTEEELLANAAEKERLGDSYDFFYQDRDDVYKTKPKDISAFAYFSTAGIYGVAEYVSEKITLGNFKFAKNNIQKALKIGKAKPKAGKFIDADFAVPKTRLTKLKDWGIKTGKGTIGESFGEGGVQIANNFADIVLLDNKDISILDGVGEAMVMGAFMNGTMASPMILSHAAAFARPEATNVLVGRNGMRIFDLSKKRDLLNGQMVALKGTNPSLQDALKIQRNQIQEEINELANKQLEIMHETDETITSLTPGDRQVLIDVFNEEHGLKREMDRVNNNKELSNKEKGNQLNDLSAKLVVQNAIKQHTLSNRVFNSDKQKARNFATAWRVKKGTLNEVKTITGKNNSQLEDSAINYVKSMDNLTAEEQNLVVDQIRNEFKIAKESSSGDGTMHGFAFGDNLTLKTKDGTKNIDIPINFAMNTGNRTVQSHEMGHQTVFKEFVANNPQAVGLVKDLESYVKKNYGNAFNEYLKETGFSQVYETKDSKGKLKNEALVAEEKLAALSDFMRKKNLKGMRTLHNKLLGRFNKFNDGSSQQIRTGKDVFDMLMSYNQSFKTGTLEGLTKGLAEGTVDISRNSKDKNVGSKKSMTKGEKDSIEDTLNDAPGQRNKDGKYTMTKAEWRADKNRAFSKAYNALMNGDLDGLIIAKMASGKDIFGQSREEFIEDAKLKIGQHMLNFDPQGRDSLFGWVNAYIGRKVGDVANKAKREKAKQPGIKISTDQKLGDEGGATVADTIKGDDADSIIEAIDAQDAANEQEAIIDNLRTRLGIEKDGELYNKVVQAVEKTFGRTKLKDVTNTEFKQDLKNKLNTELFKEVKNYLGTRKKFEEFINGKVSFKNKDGKTKVMPRWKMLFNYFSQGVVNKRFEQFKEPLINPETGKQARPDNNPLFRKRDDITQEEWTNYFLGKDVGASTKGTRKDALAAAIAEELAFDATMEVLEDSDIQNKIKEFYELQGLKQAENFTEKVGKTIDRTPGSKFSITTIQNKDLNQELQNYWTTETVREKINQGKSLITIFNEFYNKLNTKEQQALNNVKNEIEVISTARSIEADALADFDWDAQMLETLEGNIPFNLDIVDTASFNNYVNTLINEKVIPNPVIKVNGKEVNLFQQPTLPGKGSKRKDGTKKITAFSQQEYQNFKDGLQELGKFLPENLKNSGLIKTALSQAGTLYVEGKDGIIGAAEITGDLKTNKSTNKTEVKNPKVQPPKWGDTKSAKGKITKGINSLINDILNDPDFDPSNPVDTKKISDIINEKASPEQIAEIQELGIEVAKALNSMVNSQKPFSAGWWKAFNFANQILTQQTNANTGIFRMMHGVEAVSTTVGKNRPFRMEHNVQNSRFMQNIKAQILQDAINKLKNKDSKFDSNINNIYSLAKRNMMLLDKDVQAVADAAVGSPTFNQGIKVLERKFGKGWLTPQRLEMIKKVAGTTALQKGFDPNHATVINNILPFGLADKTIHVPSGLTYDQLMLNQMQGKLAVDYISSVTNGIKKQIEKSTLGKEILKSPKTSTVIKENADASQAYNDMLAEGLEKSMNPEIENNLDQNSIKLALNIKFSKSYNAKNEANSKLLNNSGVTTKFSKSVNTTQEVLDEATIMDKALNIARDPNAPIKKIRVFDFDDTLARTKSNVLYTMPDGTTGKLTAEQFAKDGDSMLAEGAVWDFSEFNKVMNGKKGPLFEVAQKIQEARGTKDVFVLTARSMEAAPAIKQFLDAVGLNIPIQNITGLGNSSPLAKSNWMVNKAAEGYNDFYFADDHLGNVDAVDKAMSVIDVKSKTQQAKIKFSKTVDQTINDIIEHKFGIKSEKEYSDVKARLRGRKKGRFKFFVPPSAEDFVGLLYSMLGKGEIGDMQMEFFKEHLIEPYGRAMENLSRDQNRMINDFKVLKAQLVKEGLIPKNLNKKAFAEFTHQDVARILAWHKQGMDIPGLSKTDLNQVLKFAQDNPAIDVFAQNLIDINKGDGYAKPGADWLAGTISTDLLDGLRTGKRGKYLEQWQQNVDLIFSPKNLNKMEAAMGSKWREAMENMLTRMRTGKNRTSNAGRLENRLLDYVNNSVGTVMFFNMRSAVLQTISAVNFINWGSNNILKAGQAFANQPQYWKDFMELMNSEFLVERRNGLKLNVSESEIADAAATSKNKAKAAIAYLLQKGYLPTQFADSFAIASGGATFYRNRIKELMKKGMNEVDAKTKAFQEFREIAEESQQSSRPDRISQQQASGLGRVILAFANTPMQYNRLIKKAGSDLINRRKKSGQTQLQSDFSNVSKMAYYAFVQNLMFNALQQAVFALEFDDEEDEAAKQKYYNVANGMLDSILRGSGLAGVGVSTILAMVRKVYKEAQKEGTFPGPEYADAAWELLNFSPPIDIKASKLRIAGNTWKYEGWKHDEAQWGIDDPAYKSAAYVISALTNIPVDRLIKKMDNIQGALDAEEETWKRISQALGWTKWQLETKEDIKEFRAQEKPKKKQALKNMYGESNPEVYSKDEQEEILKKHGYTEDEIKAMKKEEDRVKAILSKQKETGKVIKPKQNRAYKPKKLMTIAQLNQEKEKEEKKKEEERVKVEYEKYKKLKKPRQVAMLDSLGLSKADIRALQYEKDRVAKLIELMSK